MKKTKAILNYFEQVLQEYGYTDFSFVENEKQSSLKCILGKDEQERDISFILSVLEQKLIFPQAENSYRSVDLRQKKLTDENPEILIEFYVELPFQSTETSHQKVALELMTINQTLLFPGFGCNLQGTLFYRYTFLSEKGFMSKQMFTSLLGMVLFNIDAFSETLQTIIKENK